MEGSDRDRINHVIGAFARWLTSDALERWFNSFVGQCLLYTIICFIYADSILFRVRGREWPNPLPQLEVSLVTSIVFVSLDRLRGRLIRPEVTVGRKQLKGPAGVIMACAGGMVLGFFGLLFSRLSFGYSLDDWPRVDLINTLGLSVIFGVVYLIYRYYEGTD